MSFRTRFDLMVLRSIQFALNHGCFELHHISLANPASPHHAQSLELPPAASVMVNQPSYLVQIANHLGQIATGKARGLVRPKMIRGGNA